MNLRSIPASMDAGKVARIDAAVDSILREHGVAIGLAVESGSRAWGLPSPDSDYDCRFVYIRPLAHYLTPWPRRDVCGSIGCRGSSYPKENIPSRAEGFTISL